MSYLSTYDLHNIFLAEHRAIKKKKKKSEQNIKSTEQQILAYIETEGGAKHDRFSHQ